MFLRGGEALPKFASLGRSRVVGYPAPVRRSRQPRPMARISLQPILPKARWQPFAFKAAIILRFMTEWPMVAYALVLVVAPNVKNVYGGTAVSRRRGR